MKGYVLVGLHNAQWMDGLQEPVLGPKDASIKPVIVAPCTSDVHLIETMAMPYMKGKALGHEVAGVVDEVGSEVKDFKPGDRVAMSSNMPKWDSLRVQEGYYKDESYSVYLDPAPGRHGAFAERYHVVDADMNLAHLPDEVTWEQAVVLTDMAATAFEGVRAADVNWGDTVVVYGIGAVGLIAISAAVLHGAGRIIGIGSRQVCFDVAKGLGASDLVNYRDGDPLDQVMRLTNGRPVDSVIVAGGTGNSLASAIQMVKSGGIVSNVAVFMGEETIALPYQAMMSEKTLKTVSCAAGRAAIEKLAAMVANGRFSPEKIVTHTYHGMEHIAKALDQMGGNDRSAIKPVVFFD